MASIGPTLPPHLTFKRKREDDDGGSLDKQSDARSRSRSTSAESEGKRRRVLGPALPPAPIDQRPANPPDGQNERGDNDSDDDFGPAPPSGPHEVTTVQDVVQADAARDSEADRELVQKPQREEWMLAPPTDSDWTSRIDPTKLKNRRFNTGKGARAPPPTQSSDTNLWMETPDQKRKRLQKEVLGVAKPTVSVQVGKKPTQNGADAQEMERRIQEYKVRTILFSIFLCMLMFL